MRRITLWLTATLALSALLFAYQLNLSGSGVKGGETKTEESVATAPASPGADPSATPAGQAKAGDDTPGDGEHVGKPGESK
ncbi:hypothetical protein ACFWFF_33435 [Streptomyces sp. NPDC060223]|uniref:hypothetical protein n=1 Tax=unclassified Streptomyces TaxID=2593676 RepID=UPI003629BA1D